MLFNHTDICHEMKCFGKTHVNCINMNATLKQTFHPVERDFFKKICFASSHMAWHSLHVTCLILS